jgi:hypothetical protein
MVNFTNKYQLGDIVSAPKYQIVNGIITCVETHFNATCTEIIGYDYDILFVDSEDGYNYISHISERYIEK